MHGEDHGEADPAYQAIVEKEKDLLDIPCNCWGAIVFLIVNDFPDLRRLKVDSLQSIRIVAVLCTYLINFVIQGVLIYYVVSLLTLPSMRSAQDIYKRYHGEAFDDGEFSQARFDPMSETTKEDICEIALAQMIFIRVILFLWLTQNIGEIFGTITEMMLVIRFPSLPPDLDPHLMVHDMPRTEAIEHQIICATPLTKLTLCILVYIPKFLIVLFLTLSGCIWLLVADRVTDLILNSLALGFVTKIDELIAHCFFPQYFQSLLNAAAWASPKDLSDEGPEKLKQKNVKSSLVSLATLVLAFAIGELLIAYQPAIPNYRNDIAKNCQSFFLTRRPWCMAGDMDCFPKS